MQDAVGLQQVCKTIPNLRLQHQIHSTNKKNLFVCVHVYMVTTEVKARSFYSGESQWRQEVCAIILVQSILADVSLNGEFAETAKVGRAIDLFLAAGSQQLPLVPWGL